jgi:OOP family OmpA-OmpF porin
MKWAVLGSVFLAAGGCSNLPPTLAGGNDKYYCPLIGGGLGSLVGGAGAVSGAALGGILCSGSESRKMSLAPDMTKMDSDRDGIADHLDKCANTPRRVNIDAMGCAQDSDGDGVADSYDQCIGTAKGLRVDAAGCEIPVVKIRNTCKAFVSFKDGQITTFEPFYFGSNNKDLNAREAAKAACYGEVLTDNPIAVTIVGHTDSVGDDAFNLTLSAKRAQDAYQAFIKEGADPAYLKFMGRGEIAPVASNETEAGRAKNRRVEILVDAFQ